MEWEFLFNNRDSNVLFRIIFMIIWDIIYLINVWSNRRRIHSKETFFNSNWLCGTFCFFILNNFIRESRGRYFWIKNYCGARCDLQISIMILIVLSKGYVQFCPDILWAFSKTNKVAQARRKGQTLLLQNIYHRHLFSQSHSHKTLFQVQ